MTTPRKPSDAETWEELQEARRARLLAEERYREAEEIGRRLKAHREQNSWEQTFRRALGIR